METSGSDNSIYSTDGTAKTKNSGGKAKISEGHSAKNKHQKHGRGFYNQESNSKVEESSSRKKQEERDQFNSGEKYHERTMGIQQKSNIYGQSNMSA